MRLYFYVGSCTYNPMAREFELQVSFEESFNRDIQDNINIEQVALNKNGMLFIDGYVQASNEMLAHEIVKRFILDEENLFEEEL